MRIFRDSNGKFLSRRTIAWRIIGTTYAVASVLAVINFGLLKYKAYTSTHEYGFRLPWDVQVTKQSIFWEKEFKEVEILRPIPEPVAVVVDNNPDWYKSFSPLEKKVCDKWGVYECKNAVARCRAESGCSMVDENGRTKYSYTADVGAMQINELHYDYKSSSYKPECDLAKIVTEDGNIDCGYTIWLSSGWGAWSTSHNGSADAQLTRIR